MSEAPISDHHQANHRILRKFTKPAFLTLALFVIALVFWWLKLTGITIAGDAFCGKEEHIHTEDCKQQTLSCNVNTVTDTDTGSHTHTEECYTITYVCGMEEHIHTSDCYSDLSADVETASQWEATLPSDLSVMQPADSLIAVATSQLGYTESKVNFQIDENSIRRGYTRYGEWYGNRYGEWSTMFASFCLRYAGFAEYPVASGADALRIQLTQSELYQEKADYSPLSGDLAFLDTDQSGTIDATAIITEVSANEIIVIQGDYEDSVAKVTYSLSDELVIGYGLTDLSRLLTTASVEDDTIATAVDYSSDIFSQTDTFVLYTMGTDDNYYAIDGDGDAVQITIDETGAVTSDVTDANSILWFFYTTSDLAQYDGQDTYYIQNVATSVYLHPVADGGVILSGEWETALYPSGTGVRLRGARQTAYAAIENNTSFTDVTALANASIIYFAAAPKSCTLWIDGTLGGLMSMGNSDNKSYTVQPGVPFALPTQWKSPGKYEYNVKGYYDVVNNQYYKAGETISIESSTVLYPDYVARDYDIGQMNTKVSNTVSTNSFVTTHMFDYNALFNVLSERADVTVSSSSHSETWTLLTSGNNPYNGEETLNFIFRDWDSVNDITYPKGHNAVNNPTSSGTVYEGLYTQQLHSLLFDPETETIGKNYLGTADHLFSIQDDPTDEHYGYHYYDSSLHAASYNQKDQRFYVYDYLERTSDSANASDDAKYSDFLPLNSPYTDTNGQNVNTYTYSGDLDEYEGVTHYQYDAKYNTSGSSADNMGTNFFFGMNTVIEFFLPESPGTTDDNGNYGNHDLWGQEMHFKFSGDDDVWVLLDGEVVLDLGGIHGVESGDINFSTGIVSVNGEQTSTITSVGAGRHQLTILYLERGSSQSNCSIYFNLAPRFGLNLQKEDTLTQHYLNGAEFSIYMDEECTIPAELWSSKESYDNNEPSIHSVTVTDGKAYIWGLASGKTYYIVETKPPNEEWYSLSHGIIRLPLDKHGGVSEEADILNRYDENGELIGVSDGFNVHGFRIDEENMQAYLIVTNAKDWVEETTQVRVDKKWQDSVDHTNDSATVYLTVTDPDGTVRRIRETTLNASNDWSYTWENLPKYWEDGVTHVNYGVEEAFYPGYQSEITPCSTVEKETVEWTSASSFAAGNTYILKSSAGCLSSTSETATTLTFVDEETAQSSPLAQWKIESSGTNTYRVVNLNGQIFTFKSSGTRNFYATAKSEQTQSMTISGLYIIGKSSNRSYYPSGLQSNGTLSTTTRQSSAIAWSPLLLSTTTETIEIEGIGYLITNVPLTEETSVSVFKEWDMGEQQNVDYLQYKVTVDLMANGVYTGRSLELTAANSWQGTFNGLPYIDANGEVIVYNVVENWSHDDWSPTYGEMIADGSDPPTYSTTIINCYQAGMGYEMPATGHWGYQIWIISGFALTLVAILFCIIKRRRGDYG